MENIYAGAYVKLRSVLPQTKPDFASIGGFTVRVNGKDIIFDWLETGGGAHVQEDGHVVMEWSLRYFDEEFFKDSNDDVTTPNFEEISQGELDEVYYEVGYIINNEEEHFEMDLVEFTIDTYTDTSTSNTEYAFSPEQIQKYNEKTQKQRNNEVDIFAFGHMVMFKETAEKYQEYKDVLLTVKEVQEEGLVLSPGAALFAGTPDPILPFLVSPEDVRKVRYNERKI